MSGYIVVAPFSNDRLRDWPRSNYTRLLDLYVRRFDAKVKIIGTIHQRPLANQLVRELPGDRVENLCGIISWSAVMDLIAGARVVVGNNSGIPHTSARLGIPTVCIFGGTHSETEWMPRGPQAFLITNHVACSPCSRNDCPYGKRCLNELSAEAVFEMVDKAMQLSIEGDKVLRDEARSTLLTKARMEVVPAEGV